MLTLSFVDIDRDESGDPKPHFLIKRAVGMGGDRFVSDNGNMMIKFNGEDRWADERDFHRQMGFTHKISRQITQQQYPVIEKAGKAMAYRYMRLPVPPELSAGESGLNGMPYIDTVAIEKSQLELLCTAYPHDYRYKNRLYRHALGWYVPENRILPLGDNRDFSRDGRWFGPVRADKILGQGWMIHWPLGRFGIIR
jgi:signal peptidase I